MKIATIATRQCDTQAGNMLSSLRKHGYAGEVVCYTPQGYDTPDITSTIVVPECWWSDDADVSRCVNAPALCKPDVFLDKRWKDGDLLLYLDAADVLVNADPAGIADYLGEACLAAYPYKTDNMPFGSVNTAGKYYNNGVILVRMSDDVRLFAEIWKYLLKHDTKRWITGNANYRQVGDQRAFNMALRLCGIAVNDIPHDWNYRPGSQVRKLKITDDRISDSKGTEPLIIHCTGPSKMPKHLIKHCTGPADTPVTANVEASGWTVIMPAFKAAEFITEALDSIPPNIPVMIGVDGCRETLAAIPARDNIRVFMFPAKTGPYVIRNTLTEAADCERILFFDADDYLLNGGFEKIAAETDEIIRFPFYTFKHGDNKHKLKTTHMTKAHGCFAVEREYFLSTNGFHPWPAAADTEWLHRCDEGHVKILTDPVFARRKHANSLTESPATGFNSEWRKKYRDRAKDKIKPEKLHTAKFMEI